MNVIVVNQKNLAPRTEGWTDIAIDRSSPVFGNPFDMKKDENLRKAVCEAYRRYLWSIWNSPRLNHITPLGIANEFGVSLSSVWMTRSRNITVGRIQDEIDHLAVRLLKGEKLRLLCWCKPCECHGDVLVRCLHWRLNLF